MFVLLIRETTKTTATKINDAILNDFPSPSKRFCNGVSSVSTF